MKDPRGAPGTPNHSIFCLLEKLAPTALPADGLRPGDRLLTPEPIRHGQSEHEQGEDHVYPHSSCAFLRAMAQLPRCLAALIQQLSMRLRSASSSKGRLGCWTEALVRNTVVPPGPSSCPFHWRPTMAVIGLGWKSQRWCARPCSGVPNWAEVVSLVFPTISVSSRSICVARPWPWRTVYTRRPWLRPSPAAAYARGSAGTAVFPLARTPNVMPCWSSPHRLVSSSKP
jgi:hypothetical protein